MLYAAGRRAPSPDKGDAADQRCLRESRGDRCLDVDAVFDQNDGGSRADGRRDQGGTVEIVQHLDGEDQIIRSAPSASRGGIDRLINSRGPKGEVA